MHITLVKPGFDVADKQNGAINIDYAGDGIVLEVVGAGSPVPHYFDTAREAKEWMIHYAADLLELGYRISTGEPE